MLILRSPLLKVALAFVFLVTSTLRFWQPADRVLAQAGVADYRAYQIKFPPLPATVTQAIAGLTARRQIVIDAMACGNELEYAKMVARKEASEDITAYIVGKLIKFYQLSPAFDDGRCVQKRQVFPAANESAEQFTTRIAGEAAQIGTVFPASCAGSTLIAAYNDHADVVSQVSARCLADQINLAIQQMQPSGEIGSSKIPCNVIGGSTSGEWDFTMRNLVRIFYLDQGRQIRGFGALDQKSREHIVNNLLTLEAPLGPESYDLLGCGNQEHETGSPEDRADHQDWEERAGSWLKDAAGWLLRRLIWFVVIAIIVIIVVATLGAGLPLAIIVGVGVGLIAVGTASVIRVPETENHRLMIETTRYLNNQIIINALRRIQHPNIGYYERAQNDIREWLLNRMQRLLKQDFDEYNSRPYQRLSITAILNLHDFADNDQLRTGAQMVLDYAFGKAALGSNGGRRAVPFRRLVENAPRTDLFDLGGGADHQMGWLLLYTGQTAHLPNGSLHVSAPAEMIYAASSPGSAGLSPYAPPDLLIDLAINKSATYFQRIHHAPIEARLGGILAPSDIGGIEIYYSTPAFLLTAGGIKTPPALTVLGFSPSYANDRGAAVPTTLIPTAGRARRDEKNNLTLQIGANRDHFIRVDGPPDYEYNSCVWRGFACGVNIVIPDEVYQACKETPAQSWTFIDSATCDDLKNGPRFFVAAWLQACPNDDFGCSKNFGFFEVVAVSPTASFEAFKASVRAKNPNGFDRVIATPMSGFYDSHSGHQILFSTIRDQDDDEWGIMSIDTVSTVGDFEDWVFAEGDAINAKGDGLVIIRNPNTGRTLELDFTAASNPKRKVN